MLDLFTPETICRTLGERLRALRLARNLSQQDLAAMSGVSLSTVRRLESAGQGGFLAQLRRPGVLAFYGCVALMQLAHGPYYTFFSIHLEALGYSMAGLSHHHLDLS